MWLQKLRIHKTQGLQKFYNFLPSLSYNIGQSGTEKNEAVNCTNLISRRRYIFSLCSRQGDL
jgi:hypothetical protein